MQIALFYGPKKTGGRRANWMLCFSLEMSFFAVLEARLLSQLSQQIQIIFAVEWQFHLHSPRVLFLFYFLNLRCTIQDLPAKSEYRDVRWGKLKAADSFLLVLIVIDLRWDKVKVGVKVWQNIDFKRCYFAFFRFLMNLSNGIWEFKTSSVWVVWGN